MVHLLKLQDMSGVATLSSVGPSVGGDLHRTECTVLVSIVLNTCNTTCKQEEKALSSTKAHFTFDEGRQFPLAQLVCIHLVHYLPLTLFQ